MLDHQDPRRLAMQLCTMLPYERREALKVIRELERIVDFITNDGDSGPRIVSFAKLDA